jgi:hypothetical protein
MGHDIMVPPRLVNPSFGIECLCRLLELNVCVKEFSRDNVSSAIFLLELDVFVLKSLVENVFSSAIPFKH